MTTLADIYAAQEAERIRQEQEWQMMLYQQQQEQQRIIEQQRIQDRINQMYQWTER